MVRMSGREGEPVEMEWRAFERMGYEELPRVVSEHGWEEMGKAIANDS